MAAQIPMNQIPVGTKLSRAKGLLTHYGICYGNGWVFENIPGVGCRIATWDDFRQGQQVFIVGGPAIDAALLYSRIDAEISARRPYDAIFNNCEHAVTRVLNGEAASSQVAGFGFATAVAVLALAL